MNNSALAALGKIFERARRNKRLTLYQVGKMVDLPTSLVSSAENGETAADEPALEKLAEYYGVPLKMVDACKVSRQAVRGAMHQEVKNVPASTNVISIEEYRKEKWRQISLFETD